MSCTPHVDSNTSGVSHSTICGTGNTGTPHSRSHQHQLFTTCTSDEHGPTKRTITEPDWEDVSVSDDEQLTPPESPCATWQAHHVAATPKKHRPGVIETESMQNRIIRIAADEEALKDFHCVEFSPTRYYALLRFYSEELESLKQAPFENYDQDGRVDYLLLHGYLNRSIRQVRIDQKRNEDAEPLLPFVPDLVRLCEARQACRFEELEAKHTAEVMHGATSKIQETASLVRSGRLRVSKEAAYRAVKNTNTLGRVLAEFNEFLTAYEPMYDWWVKTPYAALMKALEGFIPMVKKELAGMHPDEPDEIIGEPIGRHGLLVELEAEMIPYTPEELLGIANEKYAWCEKEMKKAASELGFRDDWKAALRHVQDIYVEPGKQPQLVKSLVDQGAAYVKEHDLVTVPPMVERTWRMFMMSPAAQKVNPFFLGGPSIIVSYPTADMTHGDKLMSMRGNGPHLSKATAFHEMIPGHHLQIFMGQRHKPYRVLFDTPFYVEGWAMYWELVFWDRGDFFISPEDRVGTLFWRMHRCARILFSLKFHLGQLSPQQCVDLLVDQVGHERATAEGEVRRSLNGDYSPLYQAGYFLGAMQLYALREEVLGQGLLGEKEFHDSVLKANEMPIELLRALILEKDLRREYKNSPERVQELKHDSSVLALAVSDRYIFAGTHNGELLVWSLATFELVRRIQAHKRHVLWLFLSDSPSSTSHSDSTSSAPDSLEADSRSLLISSAGDALVSVWCPTTFTRLYEIYSLDHVGDIFSCAYSRQQDTVYLGAQDQSIQWVRLGDPDRRVPHENPNHPNRRQDRFFDSKAVGGTSTPRRKDKREALIPNPEATLEIHRGSVGKYAHFGFVYCMIIAKGPTVLVDPDEEVLISGGGDGTIKLWQIRQDEKYEGLEEWEAWEKREIMCLGEEDGVAESVFSLAIDGSFLYSGKKKGIVELWDLDTKQKLRVIKGHRGDVMALQLSWGYLLSGATTGSAAKHSTVHYSKDQQFSPSSEKVSQRYQCLRRWKAHDGKVLSSACTTYNGDKLYITGANDNAVSVWRIDEECTPDEETAEKSEDMMFSSLREFVSYKTISSRPEFVEDCRRGASFLCNLFKRLGARVHMLSMDDQTHNPVVCAVFSGKLEPAETRKRILFYGHYDVVPADRNTDSKWLTDPFQVEGINGYWYGRGVSDNKGPIMAALFAVADLLQAKQLESDVIFLIDGEEESGSRGFQETVQRNKDLIGKVDYILLANSYWLDNETPCLTYGLRGVLHATVCVDSVYPDLHSGVDGSYMVDEPLSDLTRLLSTLKGPANKIMIPHFYDSILPLTAAEEARYEDITRILSRRNSDAGTVDQLKQSLMARWREPNLTIHRYKVSGLDGSVVSGHASATISLRLVPGQEVDDIIASLTEFLNEQFRSLESRNRTSIKIDNKAEPWLGDPTNEIFKTLEEAIIKVWGLDGGTTEDGAVVKQPRRRSGDNGHQVQDQESGYGHKQDTENGSADMRDTAMYEATLPAPKPNLRDSSSTFGPASSYGFNPDQSSPSSLNRSLNLLRSNPTNRGGSIPAIRFLEKQFGAPAAHLPCGQASDAAHLENERIRMVNLIKSRSIFGEVFRRL
ncbi:hypothetical protein VMCG_10350 [Cytospora schulzeri]|uniref:Uncharacterized protein n=1 Tax=Cytospora schulzeri TaxID=448051 RepID=A0A423VFI6_9PEZI|nr:hypothetical protein VMCG_10350 [Valsa malicola]